MSSVQSQRVILSEAKNLKSNLNRPGTEINQRCFALLNMTALFVESSSS